jgi:RNA polymerase sigma factor (sigma-70 family)
MIASPPPRRVYTNAPLVHSRSVRDDLQLLEAWRDGDRSAGNELLARHFESLHRFFASKVADEVEDLIQNTLLATVKYIDAVARASSFKAYLFTIASNQLYAHLRSRLRDGAQIGFTMSSMVELGLTPSEVVAKREREQHLSLALRKLPLELQIVLELGYWEELSASEIATVLDVPIGTAKSKIRRAKQQLAQELASMTARPVGLGEDQLDEWVREVRASIDS